MPHSDLSLLTFNNFDINFVCNGYCFYFTYTYIDNYVS